MNKELIKKYKKEFEHWLDGGKLLAKHDNKGWINYYGEDIWTHSAETLIVIDDEHSIFRKALIEEKIIEVFQKTTERWIKIDTIITSIKPEFYRIKSYEPKFKVGDWVRDGDNIYQFIEPSSDYSYQESLKRCTLWQPKLGEWCIMYDTNEDPNACSITLQKWDGKNKWKPIPFIGQLPPYIKASNES